MILRFALGSTGIAEGVVCFVPEANIESLCFGTVLIASGTLVLIGLFTAYAAVAGAIATASRLVELLPLPPSVIQQGLVSGGILIVVGIAVALMGPGLFSLDFRLFGHREIVIPRRTPE